MQRDLIIALDFPNAYNTFKFLDMFKEESLYLKVGMELFYKEGPDIIKRLKQSGHRIFLDLKLHDIPTTVYKTMKNIALLEVDMVNVHAMGGVDMMKRAVEGLTETTIKRRPQCIAVTYLTSSSESMLHKELLIPHNTDEVILHYAKNALKSGLDGVVCSPLESPLIHKELGSDFLTVTPGVRLKSDCIDDQVRVTTPVKARELGSNYIVVGRSITKAKDPLDTYKKVRGQFIYEREAF